MMLAVPSLISPVMPRGRVARSAQPVLPAGGGLVLRPWLPADARAVVAAYADPAIQRWHARRVDSEDEARDLILRWQRSWQAETGAHWAVTRDEGGDVLGRAALRSMTLDEGWAECGYWTPPAARGCGVASRALAALSLWAFGEIGFHRLYLLHSVANAASCRVAAKAGFAAEGVQRSAAQPCTPTVGTTCTSTRVSMETSPRPAGGRCPGAVGVFRAYCPEPALARVR
jgi:RimJ/RimL family protein N-acetyltransferase